MFVAAAEHARSAAWRTMYGRAAEAPEGGAEPRAPGRSDEHAVRVALLWGRFSHGRHCHSTLSSNDCHSLGISSTQ